MAFRSSCDRSLMSGGGRQKQAHRLSRPGERIGGRPTSPGVQPPPGIDQMIDIVRRARPPQADPDRARRHPRLHAHRGQHMGRADLAGRTGRARADRNAGEVELDQLRLIADAGHGDARRVGQPLGPASEHPGSGRERSSAAPRGDRAERRCAATSPRPPWPARRHARTRRCPAGSRCPVASAAPGHRRAARPRARAPCRRRGRRRPEVRRTCAPKASGDPRRGHPCRSPACRPPGPHRNGRARLPMGQLDDGTDGLDHAGLVVGEHDRDQYRTGSRQLPLECRQVQAPLGIDRNPHGIRCGREHRTRARWPRPQPDRARRAAPDCWPRCRRS